MVPTVHIRFPDLPNPDSRTTVQTSSKALAIRVKNKLIIHYRYSMFGLESAGVIRASIEIKADGLYFLVLAGGGFTMERHGADDICVSPGINHCQAIYLQKGSYSLCFGQGKHRITCVASSMAWLHHIKQSLPIMMEISERMQPHQKALIFTHFRLPETYADYLHSMAYESDDGLNAAQLDHFHNLNRILAHYDRLLARKRQENITGKSYREIVDAFIRKSKQSLLFGKMQRIEEVAADMHVSPKTLNRAFHSVFQGSLTPGRLLGYMRMAAAHQLLSRNNGGMVQQTAQSLGYADTSAFTKAYKNVLGHRPSQAHLFPLEVLLPSSSEHVRN